MNRMSDIKTAALRLTQFVTDFTGQTGFSRVVVGLSGGVDSSLSAALGVKALGAENVIGLIMPYRTSSPESERDALSVALQFGIKTEKIDISPMIDAYFGNKEVSSVRKGNKMARERMSLLFDVAAREKALVMGTSNKTEICLGYATWYGDAACSFNPLGGLYKREVWEMARHFGLPRTIIEKNPTADLWPGQTDEGELGISYVLADALLYLIIEQGERSPIKLAQSGVDEKTIKMIVDRINRFAYKRTLPVTDLLGGEPVPEQVIVSWPDGYC